MMNLTLNVLALPRACKECMVLYLHQFCGLAYEEDKRIEALSILSTYNGRVPDGCINGLGGLNAEEVRKKLTPEG